TKLSEIDKLLADKAAKDKADAEAALTAKEESYKVFIAKADQDFTGKRYESAKTNYQKALNLKPDETYPKSKLAEIDNLLTLNTKKEQEQKVKYKAYQEAISKADDFFRKKEYPSAIASYKIASAYNPGENYPKQKIFECQNLIKEQNQSEQERLEAEKQKQIEAAKSSNKKLEEIDYTNKVVVEKFLSELAKKYPEGITEEFYEDETKKIKRVIVKHESIANEYREVIHNWGGIYYFRNGQSISKSFFNTETKK
ncbi:MAG: hypothetical protein COX07_01895, partial [Bacteroidetes bacterium CG23_combo_of_CG06-09_8_20_14_all_32_9]